MVLFKIEATTFEADIANDNNLNFFNIRLSFQKTLKLNKQMEF